MSTMGDVLTFFQQVTGCQFPGEPTADASDINKPGIKEMIEEVDNIISIQAQELHIKFHEAKAPDNVLGLNAEESFVVLRGWVPEQPWFAECPMAEKSVSV